MTKLQAILLSILQVLDGILTYIGTKAFNSPNIEGNPLVKELIIYFGAAKGLFFVKGVATLSIILLYLYIRYVAEESKFKPIWWVLIGIYTYVVLQWVIVLLWKMNYLG